MNEKTKKLGLKKETLRQLTREEAAQVQGCRHEGSLSVWLYDPWSTDGCGGTQNPGASCAGGCN